MMLWLLLWSLVLVPSVTSLRLLPLYSHLSNQCPLLGSWLSYTARGINSVQQTVKSPPPSHSVQEGGSLWVWKRIPRAVSFRSASAGAAESGFFVTWWSCAVDWLPILGASFIFCVSTSHHFSYPNVRTCWSKTPEYAESGSSACELLEPPPAPFSQFCPSLVLFSGVIGLTTLVHDTPLPPNGVSDCLLLLLQFYFPS